jgi:uncharacterized membrane protein YdjX (TVP38/TMEM64 family)
MGTAASTSKWKIVALAVFVASAMVASFFLPVDTWSAALAEWGEDFGWSGALLAGLLFIPACVFVLPATLLTYAIGFAFGFWPALLGVELGALLGAVVVFVLGRTFARDWIQAKAKERPKLAALDEVIDEDAFGLLFLIRLSPLFPYGLVGYMLGATRASFWRHLIATAIAILPQIAVTCWIGAQLSEFAQNVGSERERSPLEYALLALGAVVAIVVLVVISKRTRSALDAKLEEAS